MKRCEDFFKSCFCCACLLGVVPLLLSAEILTYREVEGGITITHTIVIMPAPSGYSVELASRRGKGDMVRQTFRTATDLCTLAWTFSDPGRQMELDARLQEEAIILSGTLRGKKVEKRFVAAGAPWIQLFQMGLGPFALANDKKFQFRSIGTQGPGEMKIGKFTVTRQGEEKIMFRGKEIIALRLRISLSGLLSIFWHGDYWYRKEDGRFLRYRGKNKPGGSVAVSELGEEKVDEAK